jgi:hypothetical protein
VRLHGQGLDADAIPERLARHVNWVPISILDHGQIVKVPEPPRTVTRTTAA